MMNVIRPNSHRSISLTDSELVIDFNAIDTVSVTFDESELSLSSGKSEKSICFGSDKQCFPMKALKEQEEQQITLKERQDQTLALDDATATTMASSTSFLTIPPTKTKKSVRFGSLSIHSHYVEMGGSGVPGCGPSITLGCEKESYVTLPSVEEYEDTKPYLPRRGIEMLHPKNQRVNLLLESGYTLNQIRSCSQQCESIRKQRTRTVQQVTRADRTKSTLKKLVVWKKNKEEAV